MRLDYRADPLQRKQRIAESEGMDVYDQIAAIWEVLEQIAPGAGKSGKAAAARRVIGRMQSQEPVRKES